jgi:hypothetical protein
MEYVGMPYSGEYGFIDTKVYLPLSHMVSKAEDALQCQDCHTRQNSRMANVTGVYVPGKTYHSQIGFFGRALVFIALSGIFIHALFRLIKKTRKS